MTFRFSERLNRRGADRALDGAGTSGVARVDEILAAATAPPSGFELNREADTVAMFRASVAVSAASAVKLTTFQAFRMRLAATKLAVAGTAAVLLAGGGVAYAASTGHLPEVLGGDNRSDNGSNHSSQAPGQQGTKGPQGPKATSTATAGPTTTASLKGLCNAFQKGATSNPGKAADNPAFSSLATAAGGKANIAAYCTFLIGEPGSKPSNGPKGDKTPPVRPTNAPNPNSTNKPGRNPTSGSGNTNTPSAGPTSKTHPAHPTAGANATKTPKR